MRLSLWASHSLTAGRSVVFLSSTVYSPVSPLRPLCLRNVPTLFPQGAQGPPTTPFWSNYQNHESLLTFTLSFLLFSRLWNKLPHSGHSHSSRQAFNTAVHHHLLSSPIQILDLLYPRQYTPNPPPSNSLLSFLKVPVMSILRSPSLSLPQIS